ncbi:MAG: group 1 truncated hemoglobin [Thermoanaerobacterales bacterium]|jgi:hemoglobin|nr:group 1 truncated hemoglobin [Thermoanaerobacterales bacterium]
MAGDRTDSIATPASHYERLGGAPAVREAVDRFYDRVLGDPELAHYFTDVDMPRLKRHQVLLLSQVLGGPARYDGRELGEAHRGLGISSAHYDRVVDHLVAVLTDMGADEAALADAGNVLAGVKPDIVEDGVAS